MFWDETEDTDMFLLQNLLHQSGKFSPCKLTLKHWIFFNRIHTSPFMQKHSNFPITWHYYPKQHLRDKSQTVTSNKLWTRKVFGHHCQRRLLSSLHISMQEVKVLNIILLGLYFHGFRKNKTKQNIKSKVETTNTMVRELICILGFCLKYVFDKIGRYSIL